MSTRIICQGCGQRIGVPEDYRRNKIQCPECGVITSVELGGRSPLKREGGPKKEESPFEIKGAPTRVDAAPLAAKPQTKPESAAVVQAPVRKKTPPPPVETESRPEAKASDPAPGVWTCDFCGEWQPQQPRGKNACCPVCKTPVPVKSRSEAIARQLTKSNRPRTTTLAQGEWSDDPEDSKPYRVDAAEQLLCPGCGKPMEPQAVLCLECGYDLREDAKAETIYDPIVRRWDAGLARPFRLLIFLAWQCVALPGVFWGARYEGHAFYVIGSWLWLSFMCAFLCGTYDRIDLNRNARGKVTLVRTWYFCFIPRRPQIVDLLHYEGIQTGKARDIEFIDYVVLIAGIGFFVAPGIIWYLLIMQRDSYYVALTKDHGHPEVWLYRGWSEARAREISDTLRKAALPEYSWY